MKAPEKLEVMAAAIACVHGLRLSELRDRNRSQSMVNVRREVACALREAGASYREIGQVLQRDHRGLVRLLKGPPLRSLRPDIELTVSSQYETVGDEFKAIRIAHRARKRRRVA